MIPDIIILDTRYEIMDLEARLKSLPMAGEINTHDILVGILSNISNEENTAHDVSEVCCDMADSISIRYPEDSVLSFQNLLLNFSVVLIDKIAESRCYDNEGNFWYAFNRFCGKDIVLLKYCIEFCDLEYFNHIS